MSKKTILLGLVVVSAAALALPASSSAAELHLTNVTSFSGTFPPVTVTAEGEPVITCGEAANQNHVTGTVSAGGTTGTLEFDWTGCHTSVFGFTAACHTAGSPTNNTIKTSAAFHLITINSKPGILITPAPSEYSCAGISSSKVTGSVIGTITSPACSVSSNSMTFRFIALGSAQEHTSYTGVNDHLIYETVPGTSKAGGLDMEFTVGFATAGTLDCT